MEHSYFNCPVCEHTRMDKIKLSSNGDDFEIDYCIKCYGIWFDKGEVEKMYHLNANVLAEKVTLKSRIFKMKCHSCFNFMDRNSNNCQNCNWENIIDCPICKKPLDVSLNEGIKLDYCNNCMGVWFDNIELSTIWDKHQSQKIKQKRDLAVAEDVVEGVAFFAIIGHLINGIFSILDF